MSTSKRKREPGAGLTPLLGEQLVFAETGQPVPQSEPEPRRRRRTKLAAQPVPPRPDLEKLADEISRARALDQAEIVAAGIRVREARSERTALEAEMREIKQAVRVWRQTFPTALVPTAMIGHFDRVADQIRENERAMAQIRHTLAPGVEIEHADLDREREQAAQERERSAKRATTATLLERARTQGRKEYAAISGLLDRMLASPRDPSAREALVAAASHSPLSAARADVSHPDHAASQQVRLPDGSIGQIFTGV